MIAEPSLAEPVKALLLDPEDNVAVMLRDTTAGSAVAAGDLILTAVEEIPQGHKIAVTDINAGAVVLKYGTPIGEARQEISRGAHVHVHNLDSVRLRGDR